MNLLVLRERDLSGIETEGNAALVGVQCTTIGSGCERGCTSEVGVWVLVEDGRVLNVRVSKGCDFVSCLHGVGIGERVAVVHVVRGSDGKAPSRG